MVDVDFWLSTVRSEVSRHGIGRGSANVGFQLWAGALERLEPYGPSGQSIYVRDWDVLCILDACRVDQLQEVADEYDVLPADVQSFVSLAGYSREWLARNFTGEHLAAHRDEIANTAYVKGNPFTADVFADSHPFGYLDEVWRYGWDDASGTIRPDVLSDRAIRTWREDDHDRMIVHYMQPHIPFVGGETRPNWHEGFDPHAADWGTEDQPKDLWARYRDGELNASKDELWAAYQDNLRYVLDHLESVFLRNVEAKTVVLTADHGNAIGEGGYYGHGNVPLRSVKRVPWVETSATDTESYTPSVEATGDDTGGVEERLQALGYRE